jgi:hypothetical protein
MSEPKPEQSRPGQQEQEQKQPVVPENQVSNLSRRSIRGKLF